MIFAGNNLGVLGPKDGTFVLPGAGGTCQRTDPTTGKCIEAIGADPLKPPAQVNRFTIRAMEDLYRIFLQNKLFEVRNGITSQLSTTCIGDLSLNDPKIQAACQGFIDSYRLLFPVGIIDVLGVPFNADELGKVGEDGKFEKSFLAVPEQRWLIAEMAYVLSQDSIARFLGHEGLADASANQKRSVEDILVDLSLDKGFLGIISRSDKSINSFIEFANFKGLSLTFEVPNFALNPIKPTQEELTGAKGLFNYYKRGGFLIATDFVTGKGYLINRGLQFNIGYFKCPDGKIAAAYDKLPDEGHGWLAFVTITPTAYVMRVQMKDRTGLESVGNALKAIINKIKEYACKLQPVTQLITPALIPENCVGPKGKCKKGETGCICTPGSASSPEAMAVAASNALMTKVCGPAPAKIPCEAAFTFPVGSQAFFDKKLGKWWVSTPLVPPAGTVPAVQAPVPPAAGFAGFFGAVFGDGTQTLVEIPQDGKTPGEPPVGVPPTDTAAIADKKTFCANLANKTGPCTPFYKKPLFWIIVVGGVGAAGGGYYFYRRRHTAPRAAPAVARAAFGRRLHDNSSIDWRLF